MMMMSPFTLTFLVISYNFFYCLQILVYSAFTFYDNFLFTFFITSFLKSPYSSLLDIYNVYQFKFELIFSPLFVNLFSVSVSISWLFPGYFLVTAGLSDLALSQTLEAELSGSQPQA